jgi:NarL family two-component system sensor histidine kinase YdfH
MNKKTITGDSNVRLRGAWLFYVIITLIVIAGYIAALNEQSIVGDVRIRILLTISVIFYILLLWGSPLLVVKQKGVLIYFGLQLVLPFIVSFLTPGVWLAVMLYMGMVGLGISIFWPHTAKITVICLLGFIFSAFHLVYSWGWGALWQNIPTLLLILAFVVIYVVLFMRQTHALSRVQSLLLDLEAAHQQLQDYSAQVEELTKQQERQRVARELHDTLIQGLAGLILQLEAVDSHLEEKQPEKAQHTAQQAMHLARSTMVEARQAIQNLRPEQRQKIDLLNSVTREVDNFTATTGIKTSYHKAKGALYLQTETAQEILRIIQESLANIQRHAKANSVGIRVGVESNVLHIKVEDDGVGFSPNLVANKQNAFGLRGMRERAERLGGALKVTSKPGAGTTITLELELGDDSRTGR